MRVLKWIIDRVEGKAAARETVVGYVPREGDLDTQALDATPADVEAAMRVDLGEWKQELESQAEWFEKIGPTLPKTLKLQRELLLDRVAQATR
jgi:phosphoenolpyruvate carboxykinase (GTP)